MKKEIVCHVVVQVQVEGLHRWAGCNIKEVLFLSDTHRHMFHICCKKEVSHLDRDTEIVMLKRRISRYLDYKHGTPCDFGTMSCEMIALELLEHFDLQSCCVMEDGENGANVELKSFNV